MSSISKSCFHNIRDLRRRPIRYTIHPIIQPAPLLLLLLILKLTIVTLFYSIYLLLKRIIFNLSLTLLLALPPKFLIFNTLLQFLYFSTGSRYMWESNTRVSLSHNINLSKLVNFLTSALFFRSLHIVVLGLPLLSPLVAVSRLSS